VATVTGTTPGDAIWPAGTVAVSEAHGAGGVPVVPGTQVAASEVPLKTIDIPAAKFAPVAVKVKPGPPATAELGFRLRSVGAAATTKVAAADRLPAGFTATTVIGPGFAIIAAVMGTVRVPVFTNVVTRGIPWKKIWVDAGGCALLTKFAPVTVRVNPGAPAVAPGGVRAEMEGGFTVNGTLLEVIGVAMLNPPDWDTEMLTTCAAASRDAGTMAVNCVGETKVVVSGVTTELEVVQYTTEPGATTLVESAGVGVKLVPFTVSCTPDIPADVEFGTTEVIVGGGAPAVMSIVSLGVMVLFHTSKIAT